MKMKKYLLTIATVVSVFALVGAAFAANTATLNVTSEPIRADATCDKAGGFTVTFDKDTTLTHGDQITLDLTYGVTLCRNIDIVLATAGTATLSALGVGDAGIGWLSGQINTSAPVYVVEDAGSVTGPATDDGNGVYFHIYGSTGSQRITIDVIGAGSTTGFLKVGPDPGDMLKMSFLTQDTNTSAAWVVPGIWTDIDGDGTYDDEAQIVHNTLCIDVSDPDFTATTVNENFDSKGDKFTFIPSNPQVAHIAPGVNIALYTCKGYELQNIIMGMKTGGQSAGEDCIGFDFETGTGYCCSITTPASCSAQNKLIFQNLTGAFEAVNYQIQLELLVNGASGYNGVAWSNDTVGAAGFDAFTAACPAAASTVVGAQAGYTYYRADGTSVLGAAGVVEGIHASECDIASVGPDRRFVTLLTDSADLGLTAANRFLWVDIPAINYDVDDIAEGDVVSVRATLIKAPCGVLAAVELDIGIFGCLAPSTGGDSLIFPYFTEADAVVDPYFWDGIAIVNMSSADGTATLNFFEQDGDRGSLDVTVEAYSMYVDLLSNLLVIADAANTGTLGDSRCYIRVSTTFSTADGFAMIGNSATGESLGYLPRNTMTLY